MVLASLPRRIGVGNKLLSSKPSQEARSESVLSTGIKLKLSPAILVFGALIGTLAIALVSFAFIAFGRATPSLIGYGLISTSLLWSS